jgi:hypothetical protein
MAISSSARSALTWFGLCAITLISWWLGAQHSHGSFAPNAAVTFGVIGIAAVKVRVIFREFMEVRNAPALLRHLTDAWLALTVIALIAAYMMTWSP